MLGNKNCSILFFACMECYILRGAMNMGDEKMDRRRSFRLPVKLDVICTCREEECSSISVGTTVNVSAGGALLDIDDQGFAPGQQLTIRMVVPPMSGILQKGGRLNTRASIRRIIDQENKKISRIALQFLEPLDYDIQF